MGNKCSECKCSSEIIDLSKETNLHKEKIKSETEKIQEDTLFSNNLKTERKTTNNFAEKFSNFKKQKSIKSKKSIKEEIKEENNNSKSNTSTSRNLISQLKFIDEMSQLTLIPQKKKIKRRY